MHPRSSNCQKYYQDSGQMAGPEVLMPALHMKKMGLLCDFSIGFGTLCGRVFESHEDVCSK